MVGLGFCGSSLHPAFRELAELTSGQAISLKGDGELEQLNNLTAGVLDGTSTVSTGSDTRSRKKRGTGDARDSRYNFPVDESIEKMSVTVSTTRRNTNGQ